MAKTQFPPVGRAGQRAYRPKLATIWTTLIKQFIL